MQASCRTPPFTCSGLRTILCHRSVLVWDSVVTLTASVLSSAYSPCWCFFCPLQLFVSSALRGRISMPWPGRFFAARHDLSMGFTFSLGFPSPPFFSGLLSCSRPGLFAIPPITRRGTSPLSHCISVFTLHVSCGIPHQHVPPYGCTLALFPHLLVVSVCFLGLVIDSRFLPSVDFACSRGSFTHLPPSPSAPFSHASTYWGFFSVAFQTC